MLSFTRHYDPLRPHRAFGVPDYYEFTHGTASVCVYDIHSLDFVKEIPVGTRPDCHATDCGNRYLYIACESGLYVISQASLEVVKHLHTGHVYGTNTLPDGTTMLLHDACGGMLVLRDIADMERIHIHKRLHILRDGRPGHTLGGKGSLVENGRIYLCNAWQEPSLYAIDLENDYSFERLIAGEALYDMADDLTVSADRTRAYSACYGSGRAAAGHAHGHLAVTDLAARRVVKTIPTLRGTCGLTMTGDERCVVASNDQSNAISVIDTATDSLRRHLSAAAGFRALGLPGYIQGISAGADDAIYVYGCAGDGAIVRFEDITGEAVFTISHSGGKLTGPAAIITEEEAP